MAGRYSRGERQEERAGFKANRDPQIAEWQKTGSLLVTSDYDRTMTALGDSKHTMHSVLLELLPYTAARRS